MVAGGSLNEAIGGAAAVVLSIVGLAGIMPIWMAAISAIAIGAALMVRGITLTLRYYSLLDESGADSADAAALGGGIGSEVLGGAAGVVLGILALLNIQPLIMLPVDAIVLGGTLLLGCGSNCRLNHLVVEHWHSTSNITSRRIASDLMAAANTAQAFVGAAVIVLGIVALLNPFNLTLCLIAFLAAGTSILLSGGTISSRMMTMLMRTTSSNGRRFGHAT